MASPREEWPSPAAAEGGTSCDPHARSCDLLGTELDTPSLMLRARVFARRRSLDNELADGASPVQSPVLALRARQLVSDGSRLQLATGLERLVEDAKRVAPARAIAVPVPRREILRAQTCLLGIAASLRDDRPVYARGMALLSRLLSDGSSPVHDPRAGDSLRQAVGVAAGALDGRWPTGRSA